MPLKVVHVIATSGQGSGRQVINLAESMRDLGHEVHVIYSRTRLTDDFEENLCALADVQRYAVPVTRNPHPTDVVALLGIRSYIHANGPFDVVHSHSSKAGALARLAAVGSGALRAYTPHAFVTMDPALSNRARIAYGTVERALSWISDVIFVLSDEERREAMSLGISNDRLCLIPPAIKPLVARPREVVRRSLRLNKDEVCVGFVGRLVDQKAPERLLSAFAYARRRDLRLRLLMVGGGERSAWLNAEASRLGLGQSVIWTGEIASADVFSAIDVFASTSRFEGFSAATVEAMELGIPVVATECGGMSTLIMNGVNGVLIPQASEEEVIGKLSDSIVALAANEALRKTMGRASLERSGAFAPGRITREIVEAYARFRTVARRLPRGHGASREYNGPPSAKIKSLVARDLGIRAPEPRLEDYRAVSARRPPHGSPTDLPLISVITVTLNAVRTLPRTISSVRTQSYPAVEHIVVDGGSTDGTVALLRESLRPQDFWISEPDLGVSDAFNKGIALARGRYVQLINADDWLSSDQLACAADRLSTSGADFVFGDCICYEGEKAAFRSIGDPRYALSLDRRMPTMNHPSMLVRMDAYVRFGLYSLACRLAMDYEWLLRAHTHSARGEYDSKIVAHMGLNGMSLRFFKETSREVRDIAVAYGRRPTVATAEHYYTVLKTGASLPVKLRCRPLYHVVRATINPSYRPIRPIR